MYEKAQKTLMYFAVAMAGVSLIVFMSPIGELEHLLAFMLLLFAAAIIRDEIRKGTFKRRPENGIEREESRGE